LNSLIDFDVCESGYIYFFGLDGLDGLQYHPLGSSAP
jgi:hypothetical protein